MTELRLGNGFGYQTKEGKICMVRCFSCGRENYSPAVATGLCAWCGFNPTTDMNSLTMKEETKKKDPMRKIGL